MKATIEFNFDEFEERVDFLRGFKSLDLCLAIDDMIGEFRQYLKYDDSLTIEQIEIVERIEKQLYDILDRHSININELIY